MSEPSTHPTRRSVVTTGSTLLAGIGLSAVLPAVSSATASAAPRTPDPAAPIPKGTPASTELAAYRPVTVSSTAYAPTPGAFAVDGISGTGVRGTGWRAAVGDPQWICVDLQADCQVDAVRLTFEATVDDPVFVPSTGGDPWDGTTGQEVLSSCAVAFTVEVSLDDRQWTNVHRTTAGTGGVVDIQLDRPVGARWVRLTVTERSNGNPLGLNGFQVYGTAAGRPPATGWTDWGTNRHPAPPLAVAADGTVPLESGWTLTMDDRAAGTGAELSRPAVDVSGWLPATVPGTVLTSLVEQGHLPDPVAGLNNLRIPEALSRHSWWYRREFALPSELRTGAGRHVWLEFDGVNHQADIWLNGRQAGGLTYPFARSAHDVTSLLAAEGAQALAVKITPMPFPGSPGDKGPDGLSFVDAGADMMNRNSPTYLASSGWDWMPAVRDRVSGIWNHVRLRSTGHAVIGDPRVDTRLPDLPLTSKAALTIVVPVHNADTADQQVTVTAAFDDVTVSQTVTVPAGGSLDATFTPDSHPQLLLRNPKLWWPNGYGSPDLHDLALTASVDGQQSDRRTARFGIRQFGYDYAVPLPFTSTDDAYTQSVPLGARQARYVRVKCRTRATGWGFSLWALSVIGSSAPGTDLALHKAVSASSEDGSNPAANATDGNPDTRWSSAYQDDQWIQVDLGAPVAFDRVVIVWEQAYPKTYLIQVSDDGATWTDVKSVDNAPTPLKISVNGVRVFCRGGNWGWDELLRRMPEARMDAAVRMHRDMNFTMIRNWVGCSNREEFYASCDEHGLLVWNDFPNAWGMDPPDHTAFNDLARDTVLRYRIHPSIVVWCGANEGNPPAAIDTGMRQAVAAAAPDLFYQNNSAGGIVTGGGPYGWVEPERYYAPSTYGSGSFGFHTEIGMPVVSTAESLRNLVGDEPEWPIGGAWFYHDWSTKGNQAPQNYRAAIESRLGTAAGLDDLARKAQFVNYENTRAMFEAWNANLWNDASGLMLWMSHPAWHSTVWQTYDYDFDVNGTYYGARKACEAVHVQAGPVDWQVIAVNHTPGTLDGATVTAQLLDIKGQQLSATRRTTLDVAASSTTQAFAVGWTDDLPGFHLLRLALTDGDGRVRSTNTYWRYRQPTDMAVLNSAPAVRVSAAISGPSGSGARRTLTATVRNRGSAVAAMIRLSLLDDHSGERVLPTLYGDNYLWLLPGESQSVTLSWPAEALPSGRPALRVEGYNVPRTWAR
ncbi:discoidin domain-containing protein [Streptacidiphilus carbonis]|uniref:discoidin domain-containing protein n=1 Tax=Streptacidiphilus carbonis TaxID=105422 RepID=UPI0005A6A8A9|nr:discoidin domain-containing protein [Streptacidiphilus carbonis]